MHGDFGGGVHRTGAAMRTAERSDYYFVQDFTAAGFDQSVSRSFRENRTAAAFGTDGSGNGIEGVGVVFGGDGSFAARRNRRHDSRFVDAETGRRSPRGSLCRVRITASAGAAKFRAERDGVSGM